MQRAVGMRLLSVLLCVAGLAVAVFAFLAAGRHPAAVLPGLVIFAASAATAWTPVGATRVGRVGLGVLGLGAAVALMGLLYVHGGHNPSSLLFGAVFVVSAAVLTFAFPVTDAGRDPLGWAAVAAIAVVLAVTAALVLAQGPRWLVFGGLALVPAIGLLVARTTVGPARFGLGVVLAAVAAMLTYFLAIGPVPLSAVIGALALTVLVVALRAGAPALSADPAAGGQAVR